MTVKFRMAFVIECEGKEVMTTFCDINMVPEKVEEIRSHKGWKIAESYLSDGLGHRYDETGNIVK